MRSASRWRASAGASTSSSGTGSSRRRSSDRGPPTSAIIRGVADACDHYLLEPRLLAGCHPGARGDAAARIAELRAAGITAYVDLTGPGELPPYAHVARPATHHRRPVADFGVPTDEDLTATLDLLDRLL